MIGEIIAIGNELTSGRVLNTTSRFAAGLLFSAGHEISAMSTIGDTPAEISETLKRAIKRSDFVIVTGGLGATSDDLTSEVVGQALGRPTVFHPEVFAKIKALLSNPDDQALSDLQKLALLPTGAEVLNPEARMAGYLLVHDNKPIFFLPGVPHEMQELLTEKVIPRLGVWQEGAAKLVKQRVYKVFGLGETEINRRVAHLEKEEDDRVRIGYYPVFPEVHLSLAVLGEDMFSIKNTFYSLEGGVKTALGDCLFGTDADTMESVVGELLRNQGKTLAAAESCSGGLIGHKITSVPGSSDYFVLSAVTYANQAKRDLLGVTSEILDRHGAVSEETAKEMARGVQRISGATYGLATSGIAGPGGATDDKPVGTVCIGLATSDSVSGRRYHFAFDNRRMNKRIFAATALELLRRELLAT